MKKIIEPQIKNFKYLFQKKYLSIILLIICCIPVTVPLFHHGFFTTDDGEWMIIRLSAFYAALRDGEIPVRILERLNYGYGYPVGEFLYPGIMYIGSLLHIIHFGFVNAIKIVMLLSIIGSAFFTYLWLSKLFSKTASFIGALVAIYMPYRLYDAYTRGSIGELFAMVWVPYILWSIEKKNTILIAFGIAFLILAHNTLALLFLPIVFIYALIRNQISLKKIIGQYFLGFSLTGFFIIPIIFELQFTVFSSTKVSNPLDYFAGFNLIGFSTFIILLIPIILRIKKYNTVKIQGKLIIFFYAVSLLAIFMSTTYSTLFWQLLPANFIQFPFRLLSILVVSIAFLCSYCVDSVKNAMRISISICVLLLVIFSALPYSFPKDYFDKGEGYYYTNDATTTVKDEYMPVWVKQKPLTRPKDFIIPVSLAYTVNNLQKNNTKISFDVVVYKDTYIAIQRIYWPGWNVYVDKNKVKINYLNNKGIMEIFVPKGNHHVNFIFTETLPRIFGDIVSFLALVVVIYLLKRRVNKI